MAKGLSQDRAAAKVADVIEAFAAANQTLEDVRGDLYLWRIGELTAEQAMDAIRETLEGAPS